MIWQQIACKHALNEFRLFVVKDFVVKDWQGGDCAGAWQAAARHVQM